MRAGAAVERVAGLVLESQWYVRRWAPRAVRAWVHGKAGVPWHPHVPGAWLREAHAMAGVPSDMADKRLLVFAYLTSWVDYVTAISAALMARGAQVTIAWLPWTRYERETPALEQARLRFRYETLFGRGLPRVQGIDLSLVPPEPLTPSAKVEMATFARTDTQYVTRLEEVDIEGTHRELYRLRLGQLEHVYGALSRILGQRTFDTVLIPNGGILNYAAALAAARDRGANVVTFECWERRGTFVVCPGRSFKDDMGFRAWEKDTKVLDAARKQRVAERMAARAGTKWEDYMFPPTSVAQQKLRPPFARGLRSTSAPSSSSARTSRSTPRIWTSRARFLR